MVVEGVAVGVEGVMIGVILVKGRAAEIADIIVHFIVVVEGERTYC